MRTNSRIAVLGTGVLGSQIVMQAAYHGKIVTTYDTDPKVIDGLSARWEWIRGYLQKDLPDYDQNRFTRALSNITVASSDADAVRGADVVIESVTEDLETKRQAFAEVATAMPTDALRLTNTSSLRPSDFAESTGDPSRFLALHLSNLVWKNNIGEVMGTPKTSADAIPETVQFAKEIGLVPIVVHKEIPGYLLNSILIPFLTAGGKLYVAQAANPADIDRDWMVSTGSTVAPFLALDVAGFNVAVEILRRLFPEDKGIQHFADLMAERAAEGRGGLGDGKGFYEYDATGQPVKPADEWVIYKEPAQV